ncbi:hypothetical protein SAMN05216215_101756 [Saccharopolyspora shandongensis]|uniref:Uncharacterized protein n=1 Tax=Saccharopolyspora shandongensis TaxID=418495 RepID=A0A1H3FKK9_9PSEU|nr:hypothetical protein [Saccharopolyspora shandongensis]SDX91470.1 hypothetical protein SAMN05216215_101756 [Saccharopolyspora shandongensis]
MRFNKDQAQGMVGENHAKFFPTHREGNDTPVVMQVSMSLPVSLEDIEAVLWIAVNGGMTLDERELGDDAFAHEMVLETFLHEGSNRVYEARLDIEEIKPGGGDWALLMMVRKRVRELYGRPSVPTPRRELAGA